jgi:hypothetical protein
MSILASDILTETFQILGRPSLDDLPYLDALVHVRDVARGRILDLKQAVKGHTTILGAWVTPSAREMSTSGFVGGLENFIPTKVEWRYTAEASLSPAPQPRTVQVVNLTRLSDLSESSLSETYCAFYDSFGSIAFSENTTSLSLRQYRIHYEDTADLTITAISHTLNLPDLFITLCKYETALLCLDQIRNSSPDWAEERERLRATFTQQWMLWDQRFQKFAKSQYGNRLVRKQGYRRRYR